MTATRQLVEAWEHEVSRVATLTGVATGEARIREPLDTGIGAPTLEALVEVLRRAEGWQQQGEAFRYDLPAGYLLYHADTRELEIVAQARREIQAQGAAARLAQGEVNDEVTGVGVGTYYDDSWGGHTEERARRTADADLSRDLAARGRARIDEERQAAEQVFGAELDQAARAEAERELARLIGESVEDLDREAVGRLAAIGIQGRNIFHRVLADAFREAILAYAHDQNADQIRYTERDGVLEIEFELQA